MQRKHQDFVNSVKVKEKLRAERLKEKIENDTSINRLIANLAGTWFQNKLEKTKAEGKAKVAEAKARATVAEKVATGQIEWEGKMADATNDSWKDEFALVVLLAPAILVFIRMREYVQSGFEVLATLPDWYQYLLYIAISASFGIKGVGQAAKMLRKK